MKGIAALLLSSAFFAVTTPAAFSQSTINLSGTSVFDTWTANFSQLSSNGDTGIASVFSGGNASYLLGEVAYLMNPLNPIEAFTISNAGNTLGFYIITNNASAGVNSSSGLWTITLDESGYYIANGGAQLPGYFDLTLTGKSATGSDGPVPFSGSGGFDSDLTPGVISQISSMSSDVTFSGRGAFFGSFDLLQAPAADVAPEPPSSILLGTGLFLFAAVLYSRRRMSCSYR